jgi:imidazolonepropionase-like amidohydrolase
MKRLACLLLIISCAITATAQDEQDLVLDHINIIPMNKERVIMDQSVTIRDGRIQSIRPAGKKFSKFVKRIDCTGKYLIPGLAEMHAHIPPVDDIEPMKRVLTLFLVNGVTTIRGMLGHPLHLNLRHEVQTGGIAGPRIITSGPSFSGRSVGSPEQAAAMVIDQKNKGYDFLKIHPGVTLDEFNMIVKTAREVGIPFAGHVPFEVGVWRALMAGYATIDHMDGFMEYLVPAIEHMNESSIGLFAMFISDHADTSKIPSLMKGLKQHNIWVVPTEALDQRWFTPLRTAEEFSAEPEMVYIDKKTRDAWKESKKTLMANPLYNTADMMQYMKIRRQFISSMQQYGVGILLGSDAPQVFNVPGFSVHQELEYYTQAGLTPYEALRTGTYNVGRFLKRDDIGIVRIGAVADLVVLDENPLLDIRNTRKINMVIREGTVYTKEYITEQLESIRRFNEQ